jgi:hypothetical protein
MVWLLLVEQNFHQRKSNESYSGKGVKGDYLCCQVILRLICSQSFLHCDAKAFEYLLKMKYSNCKPFRWSVFLSQFSFKIEQGSRGREPYRLRDTIFNWFKKLEFDYDEFQSCWSSSWLSMKMVPIQSEPMVSEVGKRVLYSKDTCELCQEAILS